MKYRLFFLLWLLMQINGVFSIDLRNINHPYSVIPDDNYCDQAYVVVAKNGDWISAMTTGSQNEQGNKYVVSSISSDNGKTWSAMQLVEKNKYPGSAWAIPFVNSFGRVYLIYCYQRKFVFKYSDDNGKSWSQNRFEIPIRRTTIDFINDLPNESNYQWSVSKPLAIKGQMYFTFTKYAEKSMDIEEGWLMSSNNIDSEHDPLKVQWKMLPEGNTGIVNPTMGTVQEEHTFVSLSNGDFFCNFRTKQGYIGGTYSRDGGLTWSLPEFMKYMDGRPIKHPRACPRLFQCSNGKFLLWFNNTNKVQWWEYRNPIWISGGVERNGIIEWSEPEILLYSNDSTVKMSYPDLVEADGKYYITETQKTICGVHQIDNQLLENLWNQSNLSKKVTDGVLFENKMINSKTSAYLPVLPDLALGSFTIDIWLKTNKLVANQIIFDNRNAEGNGIWMWISSSKTVMFSMKQSDITHSCSTDPGSVGEGSPQHIVFVVDGNPNVATVIVNGKLNDGGYYRYFGWSWFNWKFGSVNVSKQINFLPSFIGEIINIRFYNRYLSTSEAISNFRFGTEN